MKDTWNLDRMYLGFDDPKFIEDKKQIEKHYLVLSELLIKSSDWSEIEKAEAILGMLERIMDITYKVGLYVSLRMSVNTEDGEAMAEMSKIMRMDSEGAAAKAAAERVLGSLDVDTLKEQSELVAAYESYMKNLKEKSAHMLSDDVEAMIAAMDVTGGSAWGKLQSYLTSTLKVDYKGDIVTLSEIRNLAYSPDAEERKSAYEAELKAYEKVQDGIAFSLNNIKNQVIMVSKKRGYESPLMQTLAEAKMSRETLDAMMEAIREYLPVFRKYLRKKGELLGDTNGLKFYNLFAPLGSAEKKYSLEEAKEVLTSVFKNFTPELSDMMATAFDNEWIDFYPKNGKEGGAFCAGAPLIKESRILTNYDGTFGAVDTLAHELGHAYHNLQIENERTLNIDMAMPVAETASTFNEVFLGSYALKNAESKEERLSLLESDLKEKTQCIVDIYSRYVFETSVFEQAKEKFLMASDLKDLMLKAQTEAYGDGLDPEYMHPYMWACKSHYYSSELSFYNFPYAFGNLFAQGLYAVYLKEKESFVPKYKEMLRLTGVHSIEQCGEVMGIDLSKKEFWENSLKMMAEEIEEFVNL